MKTTAKPLAAGLAAIFALSSGLALAGHDEGFRDRARVVSSTPVYERVNEPRRECHTEYRSYEEHSRGNNTGGAIVGAMIGGVVGSQVGKGDGRVAAAAAGAATGAVIGDRWNGRSGGYTTTHTEPVERCRMVDSYRQKTVGYDVTYRYGGRNFTTRLPYDPGKWVSVNVSVSLAGDQRAGGWHESRSSAWYED